MPRLFHGAARSYGKTADKQRDPDVVMTHPNAQTDTPRSPFASAEKRPWRPAETALSRRPASACRIIENRLVHRISTSNFKDLSPIIFHAALLFPCATRSRLRGFPYRNGSQDTGRGAKVSATSGRFVKTSVISDSRKGWNTSGSWKVFGPEGMAGVARAGAGCGGSSDLKWL